MDDYQSHDAVGLAQLVRDGQVTPAELAKLFIDIAGPGLDEHGRNFVSTLAANQRLAYLPEIAKIFDDLKDTEEGVVDVTVTNPDTLWSRTVS